MHCLFPMRPGVEESKHLPAGIYRRPKMLDDRDHQLFGQVVQGCPKQDDIECAPGKLEGLIKKSLAVQDRSSVFVLSDLPMARAGVEDEVGHEYAVPQAGEIVDVGRRCVAHVDDAKTWPGLKSLASRGPAPGVARHPGPCQSPARGGRTAVALLAKPTAKQPEIPLRSDKLLL